MQIKASKKTRAPNAAEKRFTAWLHEIPCRACGEVYGVQAHHPEGATFKRKVGLVTVLLGHWYQISLCQPCHYMRHSDKTGFKARYGSEVRLWEKQMNYWAGVGDMPPDEIVQGIMESE